MNQEFHAYCGLYCEACSVYIASQFNPERLSIIAAKMNVTSEEMHCNGCKSEVVSKHCRTCEMKICAIEKGLESCAYCEEIPCKILNEFQCKMPHRAELFESLEYLKTHSEVEWEAKMISDFACENCGTLNSPYYIKCRICGNNPCNTFTSRNLSVIMDYLKQ